MLAYVYKCRGWLQGGLRAVVWTDTFQTCVVMLGLIGIIVMGTQRVGGMATVWAIAQRGNRIDFFKLVMPLILYVCRRDMHVPIHRYICMHECSFHLVVIILGHLGNMTLVHNNHL